MPFNYEAFKKLNYNFSSVSELAKELINFVSDSTGARITAYPIHPVRLGHLVVMAITLDKNPTIDDEELVRQRSLVEPLHKGQITVQELDLLNGYAKAKGLEGLEFYIKP